MEAAKLPSKLLPPRLFLLSILFMVVLDLIVPIIDFVPFPVNLAVGLPLLVAGIGGSWLGSAMFAKVRTNIHPFGEPQAMVTGGLFRISRNPMYLGFLVALIGVWLMLGSWSPLLVVVLFFMVIDTRFISYEESRMKEVFGQAYEQYTRRTRRWL
ncbi:methyltransferase family protein [Cohnella panacarvi]|uniref:methyltransferase family protein n=1 Tax=Cohnella panacarvi TaxID=400776 RepID=UPI000478C1B6|nr:isoprenylcysteine carboxylmethyltransferase family protein [Cohnella panacarvi]